MSTNIIELINTIDDFPDQQFHPHNSIPGYRPSPLSLVTEKILFEILYERTNGDFIKWDQAYGLTKAVHGMKFYLDSHHLPEDRPYALFFGHEEGESPNVHHYFPAYWRGQRFKSREKSKNSSPEWYAKIQREKPKFWQYLREGDVGITFYNGKRWESKWLKDVIKPGLITEEALGSAIADFVNSQPIPTYDHVKPAIPLDEADVHCKLAGICL